MAKIMYNVTVSIDVNAEEEWKSWMVSKHIPDVMNTGLFEEYRMTKVTSGEHENGVTYAIQYILPSKEDFEKYEKEFAPALQKEHSEKYANRFAAFRTIMEVVSEGKK